MLNKSDINAKATTRQVAIRATSRDVLGFFMRLLFLEHFCKIYYNTFSGLGKKLGSVCFEAMGLLAVAKPLTENQGRI